MKRWILTLILVLIGLIFLTVGLYIGQTDDSPGAGGLGMLLMLFFCWLSWKTFHKPRT